MNYTIGLIIICTGKYGCFVKPLLDSVEKYFFRDMSDIAIYAFTDKSNFVWDQKRCSSLALIGVPHMPFPYPTLYRYHWISENASIFFSDYIYYIDVDMLMVDYVGEEILPNESGLVAVMHPGFYASGGWGDYKTTSESTAYLHPAARGTYYAGGFQGGERDVYLEACRKMSLNIAEDESRGIIAGWNDESHWNKYLFHFNMHKSLSPQYCMVEQMGLRKKWKIDHLSPKIIALEKKHLEIRS